MYSDPLNFTILHLCLIAIFLIHALHNSTFWDWFAFYFQIEPGSIDCTLIELIITSSVFCTENIVAGLVRKQLWNMIAVISTVLHLMHSPTMMGNYDHCRVRKRNINLVIPKVFLQGCLGMISPDPPYILVYQDHSNSWRFFRGVL